MHEAGFVSRGRDVCVGDLVDPAGNNLPGESRIEALRVQLATAEADGSALTIETAELTAQLNQARRQAQEAQEAAEKKPSGGRGASWRGSGRRGAGGTERARNS